MAESRAAAAPSASTGTADRILVTGATGYVGGRLVRALRARGLAVRSLARRPEILRARIGADVEVVGGDVLCPESLPAALGGVAIAYYLIHSMGSTERFEDKDRIAAENFGRAAREAGVRRIVYLGGLGDSTESLSPHLRSRHQVGDVLRASGVETIELRASVVIGPGSLSFELVRALVERLPVMITPRWVSVPAQPIAIDDVLAYLIAALDLPVASSRIFEIGGADVVSYADLMAEYASLRGLRRWMIPVPVLTPALSSLWLGLVTPVYARIGRKLIESIVHATVVRDDAALRVFPVRPRGMHAAMAEALSVEERELEETRWSDALSSLGEPHEWGGVRFGSRLVDARTAIARVPPERAFAAVRRIGGRTGWYSSDWLWTLRGWLDLLVGGAGMRRGRRDPEDLRLGDVVDCWRVEVYESGRRLRLAAEMKLPGRAWLEFEVEPHADGSLVRQTAIFDPVGLAGLAYWYLIYPLHQMVFAGLLRGIVAAAEGPRRT
jgi:uncharacterized protein YbjT (DUF2867 family)